MNEDVVRLGVVGLGGWGKNVLRSFSRADSSELLYICDSNPQSLEHHGRLYPNSQPTACYETVLNDPRVDAVAIATPAPLHHQMSKAALLAGKHVYVEKPMTLTAAHAEELVELSERAGLKLMVGHLLEYHPAVGRIKEMVDSGELGKIHYMYCQRLNLGVVRSHENAFWSLAPHDISVILYLFQSEPDEIVARGECYVQSEVEDVVFVNLHFPDGRMAQIHVSWLDPHKERKMVVVGSKKMLVFDDMQAAEKLRIFDKGAQIETDAVDANQAIKVRHGDIHVPHVAGPEPLDAETQHFIDAIRHDTTPRSDGHDGLRVVSILEEAQRQLRGTLRIPQGTAAKDIGRKAA